MRALERLLETRIGLDCASLGPSALAGALEARMKASGCASEAEYVARASADEQEMEKLVEEVVVSETWFMRDGQPFIELARLARGHRGPEPFRVLTLPCATGEEPFSVAITLLEAGLAAGFVVDAVDISQRALAQASLAVFGERSFRADDGSLRRRWFSRAGTGWTIDPVLKKHVLFRHGNVLDEELGRGTRYEAIFCRNLLIYLGADARTKAIRNLRKALAPGATLFVGHAEALERMDPAFTRVGPTSAFAYCLRESAPLTGRYAAPEPASRASGPAPWLSAAGSSAPRASRPTASPKPVRAPASRAGAGARERNDVLAPAGAHGQKVEQAAPAQPSAPANPASRTSSPADGESAQREVFDPLFEARSLADAGRLEEAQILCERRLARDPADATAHVLLGVVLQARGDLEGARQKLERALYLDPDRDDAIAHLAHLHERLGDVVRAQALQRRAERVRHRRGTRA